MVGDHWSERGPIVSIHWPPPSVFCGYSVVKNQKRSGYDWFLHETGVTAPKTWKLFVWNFREREHRSRCIKYLIQNDSFRFVFGVDRRLQDSGIHTDPSRCRAALSLQMAFRWMFWRYVSSFESRSFSPKKYSLEFERIEFLTRRKISCQHIFRKKFFQIKNVDNPTAAIQRSCRHR